MYSTMFYFVRTRHHYDSYTDFFRLVELSGFPLCFVDEIDLHNKDNTYVLAPMNGELKAHLNWSKGRECTLLLWNLERPNTGLSQYIADNRALIEEKYITAVIVSDRRLAEDTGFHYVPVGSHAGLGTVADDDKLHDFIHLMCYSPRRGKFFDYLTQRRTVDGFSIAPNGWGEQRDMALRTSRYMLNVHQDDTKYMEPLRFALAAAYGLPIMTEDIFDWYPYPSHIDMQFNLRDFQLVARRMIDTYDNKRARAMTIHKRLTTDYSFRACVERFL